MKVLEVCCSMEPFELRVGCSIHACSSCVGWRVRDLLVSKRRFPTRTSQIFAVRLNGLRWRPVYDWRRGKNARGVTTV